MFIFIFVLFKQKFFIKGAGVKFGLKIVTVLLCTYIYITCR